MRTFSWTNMKSWYSKVRIFFKKKVFGFGRGSCYLPANFNFGLFTSTDLSLVSLLTSIIRVYKFSSSMLLPCVQRPETIHA